ncbi:MAG: hypothetical protein EA402_10910 [Planctomycetota bacterium]|nr:MAG: hypothetical protein EA402_10910 [Planctomycetota bacterium]
MDDRPRFRHDLPPYRWLPQSRLLCLLACLFLSIGGAQLTAATSEDGVFITNRQEIPIRLHRPNLDLSTVARVEFWQTSDLGRTWLLVRDIAVGEGAQSQTIAYRFRPGRDGRYGFRICVVHQDGRRDPEPRASQRPAASDSLIVDTTPPEVVRWNLDPTKDGVKIQWAISDLHPGPSPGSLEWQLAGGDWRSREENLPVHGRQEVLPPAGASALRLVAKDLAGNVSRSAALPLPTRPEETETAAVETASEAVAASVMPIEEERSPASAERDGEKESALSVSPEPKSPVAAPTAAAETPSIRLPSREELLAAAGRSATPNEPPTDHQDFSAYMPRAPEVPADHRDIIEPFHEQRRQREEQARQAARQPRPEPAAARGEASPLQETRRTQTTTAPPSIDELLRQARMLVENGDLAGAQRLYARLRGTSLGGIALPEEMTVLRRLGRHDEAIAMHRVSPPELRSDSTWCLHAAILIDRGQHRQALDILEAIGADSPQHREALFLRGLAQQGLGERQAAQQMMGRLAAIDDHWGAAARRWLAQQP